MLQIILIAIILVLFIRITVPNLKSRWVKIGFVVDLLIMGCCLFLATTVWLYTEENPYWGYSFSMGFGPGYLDFCHVNDAMPPVQGQVTTPDGQPVANAQVQIRSALADEEEWSSCLVGFDRKTTHTDDNGEFYFEAFTVEANDVLILEVSAEDYRLFKKNGIQTDKVIAAYQEEDDIWQVDPMPSKPIEYDIELKREFLFKLPATPYLFLIGIIMIECGVLTWRFTRKRRQKDKSMNELESANNISLD